MNAMQKRAALTLSEIYPVGEIRRKLSSEQLMIHFAKAEVRLFAEMAAELCEKHSVDHSHERLKELVDGLCHRSDANNIRDLVNQHLG